MSLKLFALHSIKRTTKPGKFSKDERGRHIVLESEEFIHITPGTIFDALDEREKGELIGAEAAREPTAQELRLDEAGLLTGDVSGSAQPSQKAVAKIEEERKAREERERALMSDKKEPAQAKREAPAKVDGRRRRVV